MAEPLYGGGIDPVDSEIEGTVNGGDGLAVVLRTPGKGPPGAALSPGPQAYSGQVEVCIPQLSFLHVRFLDGMRQIRAQK